MSTYKVNIPAGPLGSNEEAQKIGPKIAAAHGGRFTGQGTTVVQGATSVVEVEVPVQPIAQPNLAESEMLPTHNFADKTPGWAKIASRLSKSAGFVSLIG
jgi:Mannan-binding protein